MPIKSYFPTLIYEAALIPGAAKAKRELRAVRKDCLRVFKQDHAGKAWSASNYANGYTSYSSIANLHELNTTFIDLRKKIDSHVVRFAKSLGFVPGALAMQSCWLNVMPPRATHSLHLHPLSVISGTYYVEVPKGSGAIKFEDPRLSKMMAAPERSDPQSSGGFARIMPRAGNIVVFESWLRHEVEPNTGTANRISVSFNYS